MAQTPDIRDLVAELHTHVKYHPSSTRNRMEWACNECRSKVARWFEIVVVEGDSGILSNLDDLGRMIDLFGAMKTIVGYDIASKGKISNMDDLFE